jgi:DNA-binding NarL/FixJ family response regulator
MKRPTSGTPGEDMLVSTAVRVAKSVRVMVVDDYQLVRDGLRSMIDRNADLVVVGEAATVVEAIRVADACAPDVVVMDVRLGDGTGIEATREIRSRHPRIRVLMLTSFADDEALYASVMAGASGFVLKQIKLDTLLEAIRAVASGTTLVSPEEVSAVFTRIANGQHIYPDSRLSSLTPQEDRVLGLIATGLTNREIALQLGLAEKTVKNYISNVLGKLAVARRAQAAAYLARHSSLY